MKLKTSGLVLAMAAAVGAATYYFQDKSPSQQAFEGSNLPFSWANANLYFVITDRFSNGDKSNDNSYGRPYKDSAG